MRSRAAPARIPTAGRASPLHLLGGSPHLPALDLDVMYASHSEMSAARPKTTRRLSGKQTQERMDWRTRSFHARPGRVGSSSLLESSHPNSNVNASQAVEEAAPRPDKSLPIVSLVRKECTARRLVYMMEAMNRRQVENIQTLLSDHSTPFSGSKNLETMDAEEGRPNTRNSRPLTGSLNSFGTPLGSPKESSTRLGQDDGRSTRDAWVVDNAHTLSLLSAEKYTMVYVGVSALLSQYSSDTEKSAILRNRRGMSSFSLMNYKECIDDFQAAFRLLCETRRASRDVSTSDLNEAEMLRTWIKALIMREDYRGAEQLYQRVLDNRERLKIPLVECKGMELEKRSLNDVEKFRNSVRQEKWSRALTYLAGSKSVVEETPLRTVQAVAYLETGQMDLARETLLPYLPIIPLPLKAEAATEAPPEERQLRCNVEAHYLLTTVLLAKASVYSGRQYMNIAASLTQRCLLVHPCYPPAIRIGNYLLALEDYIAKIDGFIAQKLYDSAAETISEALRLDPANTRICAQLLCRRGETRLEQRKYHNAVGDCTRSIHLDPSVAKTYFIRSKAYEGLQCEADAAADRAMAIQLNASYEAIFEEESRQRREAERRQREQRERQFRPDPKPKPSPFVSPPSPPTKPSSSGSQGHQPQPKPSPNPVWMRQHTQNTTLYDVLSVPVTATNDVIRQAFKRLTLQCHPDKMVNETEANQLKALEMFKAINHAHSVLCDPARRTEYDLTLLLRSNR